MLHVNQHTPASPGTARVVPGHRGESRVALLAALGRPSHDVRMPGGLIDGPSLRYADADGGYHEVLLVPEDPRVVVGRAPECSLALTWDPEVSRLHTTIEWISGQWTIADDGLSRNGTFVNGERLTGRRRLRDRDRIRVGSSLLTFRDVAAREDKSTRAGTAFPTPGSLSATQRRVLTALCRPFKHGGAYASPASNEAIARELFLSTDAVKTHLRALFGKFHVEDLPQNKKRLRLVQRAMQSGVVREEDL